MSDTKGNIFSWKNFVFSVYTESSKLGLKWRRISSDSHNEQDLSNEDSLPEIPHNLKSSLAGDTVLDLRANHLSVVLTGFSFDPTSFQKIPVILLRCASENEVSKDVEAIFNYTLVGIKSSIRACNYYSEQVKLSTKSAQSSEGLFVLVPVACFSLNHNFVMESSQFKLGFLSCFQLIFFDTGPDLISVKLILQDPVSSCISFQNFVVPLDDNHFSDIHFLDIFCAHNIDMHWALLSFKDKKGTNNCLCLQFSPVNALESLISKSEKKYTMDIFPLDKLFSHEFSQIVHSVVISSVSCNLGTSSSSFSSAVIMLTKTGCVLRFTDGVLVSTVNLNAHHHSYDPLVENWTKISSVKLISFLGCSEKTAVQINSTCYLVDWTQEKITKTWSSLVMATSSDVHMSGVHLLVLVCQSDTFIAQTLQLEHIDISAFDVEDKSNDDENDNIEDDGMDSKKTKIKSTSLAEDHDPDHPLCAVNALLLQQKICQSAVLEAECQLQNKLSFLSDIWQQLSQSHLSQKYSSSPVLPLELKEPPLVTLIVGSLPPSCLREATEKKSGLAHASMKFIQACHLWQRTIDSLLVVALTVKNMSDKFLSHLSVSLAPSSHCHSPVFVSTSGPSQKVITQGSHSVQGTGTHTHKCNQIVTDSSPVLEPGSSTLLSCFADLSPLIGADDIACHVLVRFSIGHTVGRVDAEKTNDIVEYCQEFVLLSQDLVNETNSLAWDLASSTSSATGPTLTPADVLALDCVQKVSDLILQSVVNSVGCISLKLAAHPAFRYIQWADQYIIATSGQLRLCRVKVLTQSTKYKGRTQIFARSDHQMVLFVKFLYTILPEDITIFPQEPSPSSTIKLLGKNILQEIEAEIDEVREIMSSLLNVTVLCSQDEVQDCRSSSAALASRSTPCGNQKSHMSGRLNISKRRNQIFSAGIEESRADNYIEKGSCVSQKGEVNKRRKRLREMWRDDTESK